MVYVINLFVLNLCLSGVAGGVLRLREGQLLQGAVLPLLAHRQEEGRVPEEGKVPRAQQECPAPEGAEGLCFAQAEVLQCG